METVTETVTPVTEEVKPIETPVEVPKTDDQAAPALSLEAAPEVAQYELPDGTKTDAEGLAKAWRDQFMPEYTRKSQELAAIKTKIEPKQETSTDAKAPWEDPEWQPKSYQELAESTLNQAEQRVWQKILSEAERGEREAKERDTIVQQETEYLKSIDANVDVNRIKAHAAKYQFNSLIPAYQNLRALEDTERRTEERIMKNIKLRASEPVGTTSAQVGANVVFPPDVKTGLEKARYLLRQNK